MLNYLIYWITKLGNNIQLAKRMASNNQHSRIIKSV
jgi:hypothetical protein